MFESNKIKNIVINLRYIVYNLFMVQIKKFLLEFLNLLEKKKKGDMLNLLYVLCPEHHMYLN